MMVFAPVVRQMNTPELAEYQGVQRAALVRRAER